MPVTKIGAWAFLYNKSITEVVVPETVKFIEYGAFCLCDALKKVTFTSKVYLNSGVFLNSGVEEIEGIEFLTGDNSGRMIFEGTPFYENNETLILDHKLIWCKSRSEVYRVSDDVKSIGYTAFQNSAIKEIYLPEGLEEIHGFAFRGLKLKSLTIPNSVKRMGIGVFSSIGDWNDLKISKDIEIHVPEDFGRRPGWMDHEVSPHLLVVHDTQIRLKSEEKKNSPIEELEKAESDTERYAKENFEKENSEKENFEKENSEKENFEKENLGKENSENDSAERIFEEVSCIACGYVYWSSFVQKQIFPKRLEYLRSINIIGMASTNVFQTDDFKIGKLQEVFRWGEMYLSPYQNAKRRFTIIFDLEDAYAEVLFYFPQLPWGRGYGSTKLTKFYNRCLCNDESGKFFDFEWYDAHILEQDIPLRIKAEIAYMRCKSNYRLSEEALERYQQFLCSHRKKIMRIAAISDI